MPKAGFRPYSRTRKVRRYGKTIAYLYQLKFPGGKIYIGITTRDPLLRAYQHKTSFKHRTGRYSDVTEALNEYNEVCIKTLVLGTPEYIFQLEKAAIVKFEANHPHFGYNYRPRI